MIKVSHLTKYYGDHLAVDDLSFEISGGHVYGFLGPNGAGKSTTMNIITGCLAATSGTVLVDGHDIFEEPMEAKRCIGYLPEHPPLYLNETALEYLSFVGRAKGLKGAALSQQLDTVAAQTGIEGILDRRISSLSKGYRQRVGIAQALLADPKVIILDEPTVGLDPIQILEIRELIRQLGKTHTVIFSSHILSEVQALCDEIIMIAGGRLAAFDTPANLEQKLLGASQILLTTDAPQAALEKLLKNIPGITGITCAPQDGLLRGSLALNSAQVQPTLKGIYLAMKESPYILYALTAAKGSLEDVFIELTEGAEALPAEQEGGKSA